MSAPQPDDLPRDEIVFMGDEVWTDSSDSPLVVFDGPWDTTVRPRPPHIPPYMPGGNPSPQRPPEQPPPSPEKGG
jgi:hypothetical protein